jgi:hypothetical protein
VGMNVFKKLLFDYCTRNSRLVALLPPESHANDILIGGTIRS